jgi:hypothetical protein
MTECTGKALLEEKLKSISETNSILDEETKKVATDLRLKLEDTLCCVTYPVKEKYFSWKMFRFKTKIVNKNILITHRDDDPDWKRIFVRLTIDDNSGFLNNDIKMDFNIIGRISNDGKTKCLIRYDGDTYTQDEVITKVIKEIAQYTVNFNREHNVGSN